MNAPNTANTITSDFRKKASLQSKGCSSGVIMESVVNHLSAYVTKPDPKILDVGCGTGSLLSKLKALGFRNLHGCDLTRFGQADFFQFKETDFNGSFGDENNRCDVIISSETIEHLENPRHFLREIRKSLVTGGIVILTTPNPESITSILSFVFRGYHSAFGPRNYPAHLAPVSLYELKHILAENYFELLATCFIPAGRIPAMDAHWQRFFPFLKGKRYSDNYLIVARKSSP